jgi:HSP20 family protein
MSGIRRDAFAELANEFSRVQDEFQRLFNGRSTGQNGPAMNIWSDEHNVFAQFDLPGVDVAKIDISITEGNELTVQGERPEPQITNAVWIRQERGGGTFRRSFTLPVLVDPDKVEAKYENGVLRLTLPKHEAAKPRKISVSS